MSKLLLSRKLAAGRKQAYGLSVPDTDRRNLGDDGMRMTVNSQPEGGC